METAPVPVLLGPTAVGKTAVGIPLARGLGAEILSVDSRQVYRGMEIGSAAPTPEERRAVPHHLVGETDPREILSAGEFGRRAAARRAEITSRGGSVLLVGGSGLYLRAVLGGLDEDLPRDGALRDTLRARVEREGAAALHTELAALDPETAARVSPRDAQRVTRALEITLLSGRPASLLRTKGRGTRVAARMVILDREREDLLARIRGRALAMAAGGLRQEVEALLAAGLDARTPALRSVGYAETVRLLDGRLAPGEWVEAIVTATRRLAKRQRTWFRSLDGAVWLPIPPGESPETTAGRARAALRGGD